MMLAIDVHGLNKWFGDHHVVQDVSIAVGQGKVTGFLGPNGSGKTTTLRLLCGLLTPNSGVGTVLGRNFRTQSEAIKRETGYMTQRFSLYEDMTIAENLLFVARVYGLDDRRARCAERLGLRRGGPCQRYRFGCARSRMSDEKHFSLLRIFAVLAKEFTQLRRDRVTFAMILGIPIMQLLLFGYAINNDPRHLPAAVISHDPGNLARAVVNSLEHTGYVDVRYLPRSEAEMDTLIRSGKVILAVTIPPDFTRRVLKHDRPRICTSTGLLIAQRSTTVHGTVASSFTCAPQLTRKGHYDTNMSLRTILVMLTL